MRKIILIVLLVLLCRSAYAGETVSSLSLGCGSSYALKDIYVDFNMTCTAKDRVVFTDQRETREVACLNGETVSVRLHGRTDASGNIAIRYTYGNSYGSTNVPTFGSQYCVESMTVDDRLDVIGDDTSVTNDNVDSILTGVQDIQATLESMGGTGDEGMLKMLSLVVGGFCGIALTLGAAQRW